MKRIMLVAVLLVAVSMLLFGCELFQPQADVRLLNADYDTVDTVTVNFEIENTGTMTIAWWEVKASVVETDLEIKYGSWSDGPLSTGATDTVTGLLEIYVDNAPQNYNAFEWYKDDVTIEVSNLEAE
jgi:hypothetical protein